MIDAAREEVEVINSIYEDAASLSEATSTVILNIPDTPVSIKLWFPLHYPDEAPKVSTVTGVRTTDTMLSAKVQDILDNLFVPGEVVMFTLIDEVRPLAEQWLEEMHEAESEAEASQARQPKTSATIDNWYTSDEIRDRGSVFVGRCIAAHTEAEVDALLSDLLDTKKLYDASHNMVAWRLMTEDGNIAQSSDNDGESGSGTVLLHLLDSADARNVIVVVSRYFNGTHIGGDRFKHIKNSARDALAKGGFIN